MEIMQEDPADFCASPAQTEGWQCRLEVETDKIAANLKALSTWTQAHKIAVVKNNGYGLGIVPYARLLQSLGIDTFAVAYGEEGVLLRNAGITGEILVMTPPQDLCQVRMLADSDLTATVDCPQQLQMLEQLAQNRETRYPVHIKFDSGFGRFGFPCDKAQEAGAYLDQCPHVELVGAYSHCGTVNPKDAQRQFALFCQSVATLSAAGHRPRYRHFCNSSLTMIFPQMHLEAVRLGSALLGRLPRQTPIALQQVGRMKARIMQLRQLPKGSCPGYAGVIRLKKDTPVAVANVGWQDGIDIERHYDARTLHQLLSEIKQTFLHSGKPHCADFNGEKLPILGRGGMNFSLLDVTGSTILPGDWVCFDVNPLMVRESVPRMYTAE